MKVTANEFTKAKLDKITASAMRVLKRTQDMREELKSLDDDGQTYYRSHKMGALKRAVLDFKHDVKL